MTCAPDCLSLAPSQVMPGPFVHMPLAYPTVTSLTTSSRQVFLNYFLLLTISLTGKVLQIVHDTY